MIEGSVACSILWFMVVHIKDPLSPAPRALVVGNNRYCVAPLHCSANDAFDVAKLWFRKGYDVDMYLNATSVEMSQMLRVFARTQSQDGLNVVHFSGHGTQSGEDNYLVPVDGGEAASECRFFLF
jgi:uncharacterized caspase-like protein